MKSGIFVFIIVLAGAVCAEIINVDAEGTGDYPTIQEAINAAAEGDTIIVQPGRYADKISFNGKNVFLTSIDPTNSSVAASTIIGEDKRRESEVEFDGSEDESCVFTGFNVKGLVSGNGTKATISHCMFVGNKGVCGLVISGCDGIITNCIIANNRDSNCRTYLPVSTIDDCHGIIKNCTLNASIKVEPNDVLLITNSILYESSIYALKEGYVSISYSAIYPEEHFTYKARGKLITINWMEGNILGQKPYFVDYAKGDYHLQSAAGSWDSTLEKWMKDAHTSVCIDAGDPNSRWEGELRPNGKRINMGAYGGTAEASMSPSK